MLEEKEQGERDVGVWLPFPYFLILILLVNKVLLDKFSDTECLLLFNNQIVTNLAPKHIYKNWEWGKESGADSSTIWTENLSISCKSPVQQPSKVVKSGRKVGKRNQ